MPTGDANNVAVGSIPTVTNIPEQRYTNQMLDNDLNVIQALLKKSFGQNDWWKFWQKYQWIIKYFASLYQVETNDENFLKIQRIFYSFLYENAELFITKINNQYQLWRVGLKIKNGVNLLKVKCQLILENKQKETQFDYVTFTNLKDGIYVQWDSSLLPAYLQLKDFIYDLNRLETVFLNNAIFDTKKFIKIKNNENEIINEEEKASFFNTNPFVEIANPIASANANELPNIFKEIKNTNSMSEIAYRNLVNFKNYYFDWLGMAVDSQTKLQRKTELESDSSLYNTVIYEKQTLDYLNTFAKQAKTLWNVDMKFNLTHELNPAKNDLVNKDMQKDNKPHEK